MASDGRVNRGQEQIWLYVKYQDMKNWNFLIDFFSDDCAVCRTWGVGDVKRRCLDNWKCKETPSLCETVTEIFCWLKQKAVVKGINYWNLIQKQTFEEIRQLGNKRNNYIKYDFSQSDTDQREKPKVESAEQNPHHSEFEAFSRTLWVKEVGIPNK